MKLFIDSADVSEIQEHFATGLIDGVTTNPTLIMKSGRNPEEVYQELIDTGIQDSSMEVVGDRNEMLWEGRRLANKFDQQATIKVPCTPDGLWVCKELSKSGVKVNVTLIFSQVQAILSAKAGAKYVSPFIGRLDDIGHTGMDLIKEIKQIFANYDFKTQILVASVRHPQHVIDAAKTGADVVTLPSAVLGKMLGHALTDKGLKAFLADWEKLQSDNTSK